MCVLAVVAYGSVGMARRDQENAIVIAVSAAVLVAGCALVARLARRWGRTRPLLLQVVDTTWWLGLVLFAGDLAPAGAWALLTVPIVGASIRGSELHVLSTWLVAASAYFAITSAVTRLAPAETGTVINALGVLLAVAAGVAVLTRWLAEGWVDQQALTERADQRLAWLEHLQRAARTMRTLTPPEIIELCLQTAVDLGFDAATAGGTYDGASGATALAPSMPDIDIPGEETIEIAAHEHRDAIVYSAAGIEPVSGTLVVGWSTQNPTDELAAALGDLLAQTALALETATHLAAVRYDATHDALTRLANRRRLEDLLETAASEELRAAVIFIDLDRFKPINDTYGHEVGDQVLRTLADRISSAVEDVGTAVRYGGDEFVVILTGNDVADAPDVAHAIGRQMRLPVHVAGRDHQLSGSVGVAQSSGVFTPESLIQLADEQAYRAKRAGGDRVVGAWNAASPEIPQAMGEKECDATALQA